MSLLVCRIHLQTCVWELYARPWHISTVFADSLRVEAAPDHARDLMIARAYGYGDDTLSLWRHHDLYHTVLLQALGYPYSPTLRNIIEPGVASDVFRAAEEAFVLDTQYFLNGGPPPWPQEILTHGRI
jgi:hypothetical protein